MNCKLLAIDIDGTLINSNKTILPETIESIKKASFHGVETVLVTARHHLTAHSFYRQLGLSNPIICCNGAYIYDYNLNKRLKGTPIASKDFYKVIDVAVKNNCDYMIYTDDLIIYNRLTMKVSRLLNWMNLHDKKHSDSILMNDHLTDSFDLYGDVWKIDLVDPDPKKLYFLKGLLSIDGDLSLEISWKDQLDVIAGQQTKGNALQYYTSQIGVKMSDVIAIGDNDNDVSMFKIAGLSVAMGNATSEAKVNASLRIHDHNSTALSELINRIIIP